MKKNANTFIVFFFIIIYGCSTKLVQTENVGAFAMTEQFEFKQVENLNEIPFVLFSLLKKKGYYFSMNEKRVNFTDMYQRNIPNCHLLYGAFDQKYENGFLIFDRGGYGVQRCYILISKNKKHYQFKYKGMLSDSFNSDSLLNKLNK